MSLVLLLVLVVVVLCVGTAIVQTYRRPPRGVGPVVSPEDAALMNSSKRRSPR